MWPASRASRYGVAVAIGTAGVLTSRCSARRRGVALDSLSDFRHPQAPPLAVPRPALVVGYGAPPEHAYPAALKALCGALADGGAG